MITVFGKQFEDWTSNYSLYCHGRVDACAIFRQVRKEAEALARPGQTMCVALDDTLLRKRGRMIPGAAYRRDPLGPPFQVNLVWAQREQAISVAIADENGGIAPTLRVLVDGSYTNKNVLRKLPENTVLIGRIRKDAKLSAKPAEQTERGRRRIYGEDLPTPPSKFVKTR